MSSKEDVGDLSHRRSKSMLAMQNAQRVKQKADIMIFKQTNDPLNIASKKSLSKRTGRAGSILMADPYNEQMTVIKKGR